MLFFQPDSGKFGELLVSEISREGYRRYDSLTILVAYAKHSGVARIANELKEFRARGGTLKVVVGINQQQTTIEAIQLLSTLAETLTVFYDENDSRTFHPKIYWLQNKASMTHWAAIGSNNLTAGGLYTNYEISAIFSDDKGLGEDTEFSHVIGGFLGDVKKKANLLDIDTQSLQSLIQEGYVISEQESRQRSQEQKRSAPTGSGASSKPLFGRSILPLLPPVPQELQLPPLIAAPTASPTATALKSVNPPPQPAVSLPSAAKPSVSTAQPGIAASPQAAPRPAGRGFWKRLSDSDVSRSSSPGQLIIPLKYLGFFPSMNPPTTTNAGAKQSDVHLIAEFREAGSKSLLAKDARAVRYEPAPAHKRKNVELRFTFRNREIFLQLSQGDILEFFPTGIQNPAIIVIKQAGSSHPSSLDDGVIP